MVPPLKDRVRSELPVPWNETLFGNRVMTDVISYEDTLEQSGL